MVTAHALERVSERMGFSLSTAGRVIENAYYRGYTADDLNANERRYLKAKEDKEGCCARFYNGFCFIFNEEGTCITMYLPPKWFGKKRSYIGKVPVRDEQKYAHHYAIEKLNSETEDEIQHGI